MESAAAAATAAVVDASTGRRVDTSMRRRADVPKNDTSFFVYIFSETPLWLYGRMIGEGV